MNKSSSFFWLLVNQPEELELLSQGGAVAATAQFAGAFDCVFCKFPPRTLGVFLQDRNRLFEQCLFVDLPCRAVYAVHACTSTMRINQQEGCVAFALAQFNCVVGGNPAAAIHRANGDYLPIGNHMDVCGKYLLNIITGECTSKR